MWKCLGWQFAPKLRLEFNCFAKSLNEMWFYLVVSDLFIYLFIYSEIYAVHFQTRFRLPTRLPNEGFLLRG